MKVEFLVNTDLEGGRQLFIEASEFNKAATDDEEFDSFAFATHAFFSFYGINWYVNRDEYDLILKQLGKNGAVIITAIEEKYPTHIYPEVFVSNNNKRKRIDLNEANRVR